MAQVERNVVEAVEEDIKIPNYSKVSEYSWNEELDYALIPKETLKDGKGAWPFFLLSMIGYNDYKPSLTY